MLQCRIYPKKTEIRKRFLKVTQTFLKKLIMLLRSNTTFRLGAATLTVGLVLSLVSLSAEMFH